MQAQFNILSRIESILRKVIYSVGVTAMMALTFVVLLAVLDRYILHFNLFWTSEVSKEIFIWVSLLGATILVERTGLLRIDLIDLIVPPRFNSLVSIIGNYAILLFLLVLLFFGIILVIGTVHQKTAGLGIPMCFIYLSVPVNALLMGFFIVNSKLKRNRLGPQKKSR